MGIPNPEEHVVKANHKNYIRKNRLASDHIKVYESIINYTTSTSWFKKTFTNRYKNLLNHNSKTFLIAHSNLQNGPISLQAKKNSNNSYPSTRAFITGWKSFQIMAAIISTGGN